MVHTVLFPVRSNPRWRLCLRCLLAARRSAFSRRQLLGLRVTNLKYIYEKKHNCTNRNSYNNNTVHYITKKKQKIKNGPTGPIISYRQERITYNILHRVRVYDDMTGIVDRGQISVLIVSISPQPLTLWAILLIRRFSIIRRRFDRTPGLVVMSSDETALRYGVGWSLCQNDVTKR